jgi:hypothetical protein
MPQGKWVAVVSDQAAKVGAGSVLAALLSHTSATSLVLYDSATAPAEMLANPGFETAGAGGADIWDSWVETAGDGALANETGSVHGGSDAAKATAGATANTKVEQAVTVVPGLRYTLSLWTRGDGTNEGRYRLVNASTGAAIIATVATGVSATSYAQVSTTFLAPSDCTSVRLDLMCPSADTGIAYYDDVSIALLPFATVSVPANETIFSDFSEIGGLPFQVGVWVDWTAGVARLCID